MAFNHNDNFEKRIIGVWVVGVSLGLAFWGGLIYFTLWCLSHFGVLN